MTKVEGYALLNGKNDNSGIDITVFGLDLEDTLSNIIASTVTDSNGYFSLINIPQGNYLIQGDFDGYKSSATLITLKYTDSISTADSLELTMIPFRDVYFTDGYDNKIIGFNGEFEDIIVSSMEINNEVTMDPEYFTVGLDSVIYFFNSKAGSAEYDTLYAMDDITGTNLRKMPLPGKNEVFGLEIAPSGKIILVRASLNDPIDYLGPIFSCDKFGTSFTKTGELGYITASSINYIEFDSKGQLYFWNGNNLEIRYDDENLSNPDTLNFDDYFTGFTYDGVGVDRATDKIYLYAKKDGKVTVTSFDDITGVNQMKSPNTFTELSDISPNTRLFVENGILYFPQNYYDAGCLNGTNDPSITVITETEIGAKPAPSWVSFSR